MSLLPIFEYVEATQLGDTIRESLWLFPAIEAVHLIGLAVIAGAVLVVDMRLCGVGLRRQPVAQLAADVQPWLIGSLIVMLTTGSLLFTSEAIKCYYSAAFWWKMTSLSLAIGFTFTVRRKVAAADEARVGPRWSRLVGLASLALWSGVGVGGRLIGFS